jgi:hypothetical protein
VSASTAPPKGIAAGSTPKPPKAPTPCMLWIICIMSIIGFCCMTGAIMPGVIPGCPIIGG